MVLVVFFGVVGIVVVFFGVVGGLCGIVGFGNKWFGGGLVVFCGCFGGFFLGVHSCVIGFGVGVCGAVLGGVVFMFVVMVICGFELVVYCYFDFNDDGVFCCFVGVGVVKVEKVGGVGCGGLFVNVEICFKKVGES